MRYVLILCLLATGCTTAAFPERPAVSFYEHLDPMMVPDPTAPRKMIGSRVLMPPPVPAGLCLTEADHLALEGYFDQIDAWRARAGR